MKSKNNHEMLWVDRDFKINIKVAASAKGMSMLEYTKMLAKEQEKRNGKKKYEFRI